MPELPEVETVCRTLKPYLTGRQILAFELLWPRTLSIDAISFQHHVARKTIVDVRRRAKLIQLILDDESRITVHLRMTGELLWLPSGALTDVSRQPYLRAEFLLDDGSSLLFYDTRKFGRISWYSHTDVANLESAYGIEPLGPDFTAGWLRSALSARRRQMKPLLLDQTVIAGLGNIYVDEALFQAKIHPQSLSDRVPAKRVNDLHAAIVQVLNAAIVRNGTTLRNYRSGTGEQGTNQSHLKVYGATPGSPCLRCGTGLVRIIVGQRGTTYCPKCQRLARSRNTPNQ